jgi:transcriptional regulator of acetoin/glycerol metabolism
MSALVQQAAAEIERSLFDQASERERALLQEFLVANRRANGAVVTVSDDLIIVNKPAAQLLDPDDHPLVRQAVVNLMASKRQMTTQVDLVRGQAMQLRYRPVITASGLAGAIVELKLSGREDQPRVPGRGRSLSPLPNLVGHSPVWLRACERIASLGQDRSGVLITGEPGVGKCAVAEASHRRRSPIGRLAVVDLADAGVAELRATTRLEQVLALAADPSATVVLRHAEQLTAGELVVLANLQDELRRTAAPNAWLVATSASPNLDHLLELFPASLSVPPLRHHREDIRDLVPAFIERYAPRQSPTLTSDALQALLSAPWPGNIAQLEGVVRLVLSRQRTGYIALEDLPPECHTTSHRALTHWETLERDAIVQTLLDTGGDRVEAAQRLGISRATIYRKVNAYGITLPAGRG